MLNIVMRSMFEGLDGVYKRISSELRGGYLMGVEDHDFLPDGGRARCQVPGAGWQVPGVRCQVPGAPWM